MIKKIIGWTILIGVFVLLVGATIIACGWQTALATWLISIGLAAAIIVAVFLIVWGD